MLVQICTNLDMLTQNYRKMSSSVGGFSAPSMITHYCLRTPEEVLSSNDGREFTPAALFSPVLSLAVLFAIFLAGHPERKGLEPIDEESPSEETPLVESNIPRRRSAGDTAQKDVDVDRRQRRRPSLMDVARSASIRGSMLTPMTLIPTNGKIYE